MHRQLKELLHNATGESRRVVVVFLDVRGFSTFANVADNSDAAEFLKSVYLRILDDYFPEATFFKPTGDGLLILLAYDRESLRRVVGDAVATCVRLVDDFGSLTVDDDMINFDVPTELGIGLARGSATALVSEGRVLDYSGRYLNLAARLMDLARPSGVVFDPSLGPNLLPKRLAERFKEEQVYIKGLAEDATVPVLCLADRVRIAPVNKRPMGRLTRHVERPIELKFRDFGLREDHLEPLTRVPADTDQIKVHVNYPKAQANGRKNPDLVHTSALSATYVEQEGAHFGRIDYRPMIEQLREQGVRPNWEIEIVIEYPVFPSAA